MPKSTILQLSPPSVPVFAVFTENEDGAKPTKKDDIFLVPCPMIGLIKQEDDETFAVPLLLEDWALEPASGKNLLGFVHSEAEAVSRFIDSQSTPARRPKDWS